jgi:hypothetical protein
VLDDDGAGVTVEGLILPMTWTVRSFATTADPRDDVEAWRRAAEAAPSYEIDRLDLRFGSGSPSSIAGAPPGLPADHFGTAARTSITLPAGRWILRTISDDGLRVRLDGELVIDDWTWHAPAPHDHPFELDEARTIAIEVEHFELDGYAVLEVSVEPG